MNSLKVLKQLKYQHVVAFDKDFKIYEYSDIYVVPILTEFSVVIPQTSIGKNQLEEYVRFVGNSHLYNLGLEGTRTIEPIILAYYSKGGIVQFHLARHGYLNYAEAVAFNTDLNIIFDTSTRTMMFLGLAKKHGQNKLNELWSPLWVDDDLMVSNYGRMRKGDTFIKQERRRYDFTDRKGNRHRLLVQDVVHNFYNKKKGKARTMHEPLNFHYKNVTKLKEK